MRKSSKAAETADSKNASYYRQQTTTGQPFRSPFAMLNLTAHDCQQQRAAVGMSDDDLERDKSIFNSVIDGYIAKHGYPDTNEKVDAYLALAFEFVIAGMRDSRYPQAHWPLVACHAALVTLKGAQDKKTFKVDAVMTNIALFAQAMMNIAWKPARVQEGEGILRRSLQLCNDQQETNRILNAANQALTPLAEKGHKFKPGRKKGTLGRTALRMLAHLAKHPSATPIEVWGAFAAKPEKNYAYRNSPQLGRYIEDVSTGKTIMGWAHFRNLVSAHRPK